MSQLTAITKAFRCICIRYELACWAENSEPIFVRFTLFEIFSPKINNYLVKPKVCARGYQQLVHHTISFHITREASSLTKTKKTPAPSPLSLFLSLNSFSLFRTTSYGGLGPSVDRSDPLRSSIAGTSFPDSGGRSSCRIR